MSNVINAIRVNKNDYYVDATSIELTNSISDVNNKIDSIVNGATTFSKLSIGNVNASSQSSSKEETKSWSVTDFVSSGLSFNGTTGTWDGIYVDATNGKLTPNGDWIQSNEGLKLYIPVSAGASGEVSITAYNSNLSPTGGSDNRSFVLGDSNVYTLSFTSDDIMEIDNNTYVNVTIGGNSYINVITYSGIVVTSGDVIVNGSVLFGQSTVSDTLSWSATNMVADAIAIQKTTGSYNELYVDATNGKFSTSGRTSDVQVTTDTIIYVPYKGDGNVTIKEYHNYGCSFTTDATLVSSTSSSTGDISVYNVDATMVVSIDGTNYVAFSAGSNGYLLSIEYSYTCTGNAQLTVTNQSVDIEDCNVNNLTTVLAKIATATTEALKSESIEATDLTSTSIVTESIKTNKITSGGKSVSTSTSKTWTPAAFKSNGVSFNKSSGTWDDMYVDATNGKLGVNNDSWTQANAVIYLYIPAEGSGTVTINGYGSGYSIVGGVNDTAFTENNKVYTLDFTESDLETLNGVSYIKVTWNQANGYVGNISIESTYMKYSFSVEEDGSTNVASLSSAGELTHGSDLSDSSIAGQVVPYFKVISQDDFDALSDKDDNVIYLITE